MSVDSLVLLPLAINVTFLANGRPAPPAPAPPLPHILLQLVLTLLYVLLFISHLLLHLHLHLMRPPRSPSSTDSASVVVHVINGEHPAAMQHGNSSASSLRWSPVPLFALTTTTTAAAFAVTWNAEWDWNWDCDWDWNWDWVWNWSSFPFVSTLPAALSNSWSRHRQRSSSWS